jgi:hypothetical protein
MVAFESDGAQLVPPIDPPLEVDAVAVLAILLEEQAPARLCRRSLPRAESEVRAMPQRRTLTIDASSAGERYGWSPRWATCNHGTAAGMRPVETQKSTSAAPTPINVGALGPPRKSAPWQAEQFSV